MRCSAKTRVVVSADCGSISRTKETGAHRKASSVFTAFINAKTSREMANFRMYGSTFTISALFSNCAWYGCMGVEKIKSSAKRVGGSLRMSRIRETFFGGSLVNITAMIIAKFCLRDQRLHAAIAQFSMAFSSRQFFSGSGSAEKKKKPRFLPKAPFPFALPSNKKKA